MAKRRITPLEIGYVLLLAGVAVFGFTTHRHVPDAESPAVVFTTVTAAGASFPLTSLELYQTADFTVRVPPTQLAGRGSFFDVDAAANFTNPATGDSFTTRPFYDGGADGYAVYRFRFTPTSVGSWSLSTTSDVPALAGLEGTVRVQPSPDPARHGFLTSANGRFAAPVAGSQELEAIDYQVYFRGGWPLENLGALPRDDERLREVLGALLDEAATNGFNAVLVGVWHHWFELGTSRSDRHFSVEPDPATFRVLETLAAAAHARGMNVHIWQWGDEQRLWSPRGIPADARSPGDSGGVNGVADRRLQRYIAARLGPLPNWSLSYGFDLNEWADEDAVRSWAEYVQAHSARPHLLTGMEVRRSASNLFDLGDDKLGLVSKTRVAESAIDGAHAAGGSVPMVLYDAAVIELAAAGGKPVIFETRYLHMRDDLWTQERTLRSLWSLSMAGGVAAIWGVDWDLQASYPQPEQLRTHRAFWAGRPAAEMISSARSDGSLTLMSPGGERGVIYAPDAARVELPLLTPGVTVTAVDTRRSYEPLDISPPSVGSSQLGAGEPFAWDAPYVSDWALAIEPPAR